MAAAVLIHGWALWALARAIQPPAVAEVATEALQVIWIERATPTPLPHAVTDIRQAARTPRLPPPPDRPPSSRDHLAAPLPAAAPGPAPPAITRPLSAVYLADARRLARAEGDEIATAQHPFADRAVPLPGKPGERFRMRQPLSPARAVARVGMLFGGSDPDEPCRSNRAQIAALGTAGDSAALQRELDFERRHCRP